MPKRGFRSPSVIDFSAVRCMFNWRKIQEMLKLKDFLIQVIERHTEISMEERGNLLGECDLITSFLMYNDISKMSHFHRSCQQADVAACHQYPQ